MIFSLFFLYFLSCLLLVVCFLFFAVFSFHDGRAELCREQEQERRERGPPPASRSALRNIPEVNVSLGRGANEAVS